jgi:hypothetical protein
MPTTKQLKKEAGELEAKSVVFEMDESEKISTIGLIT